MSASVPPPYPSRRPQASGTATATAYPHVGPPRPPSPPARQTATPPVVAQEQSGLRPVVQRIAGAARTTPGRLLAVGAALAVLCLVAAVLGTLAVRDRSNAARDVATGSEPLVVGTQNLYGALADADASAAAGLLSGGNPPPDITARYNAATADTGRYLTQVSSGFGTTNDTAADLATVSQQFPSYTAMVERARAEARQDHTVSSAYQRRASTLMRDTILPAADRLHTAAVKRLNADNGNATSLPIAAVLVAVAALAGLVAAQVLVARRTKRVFNVGLLAATVAMLVSTAWLIAGLSSSADGMNRARDHGWKPEQTLAQARFESLNAYADEGLTLIMRGADNGSYETDQQSRFATLTGQGPGAGLLGQAQREAGSGSSAQLTPAVQAATAWESAHKDVVNEYLNGQFPAAVAAVTTPDGASRTAFTTLENTLTAAGNADQQNFAHAVKDGRDALAGLTVGVAVLGVLAAAGVVDGVRRRVGEYR